jgi:hypothetical protein
MGTELPTKVMLGQTLLLMQMTFLNNVRKVGRLVLSRTSCFHQVQIDMSKSMVYMSKRLTNISNERLKRRSVYLEL